MSIGELEKPRRKPGPKPSGIEHGLPIRVRRTAHEQLLKWTRERNLTMVDFVSDLIEREPIFEAGKAARAMKARQPKPAGL